MELNYLNIITFEAMNEKNENLEVNDEQVLSPQETESVEGGVSSLEMDQDLQQVDDSNTIQCGCNNYQCGKKLSNT